jgi:carboxyl-terminal processing protease
LSNPEDSKKENEPKAKKETPGKADNGANVLKDFKPVEFGTKEDKQYQEALNVLKGINLYQTQ